MDENNNNGNFNFGPNNFGNQGFDTNPLGNIPNDPFAGQTNNIPQNGFDNFGSAPVAPQEPVIENPVTPNVEPAPAPIIEEPITFTDPSINEPVVETPLVDQMNTMNTMNTNPVNTYSNPVNPGPQTTIPNQTNQIPNPGPTNYSNPQSSVNKKNNNAIKIILVFLILIVLVVIGYFVYTNFIKKDNKKPVNTPVQTTPVQEAGYYIVTDLESLTTADLNTLEADDFYQYVVSGHGNLQIPTDMFTVHILAGEENTDISFNLNNWFLVTSFTLDRNNNLTFYMVDSTMALRKVDFSLIPFSDSNVIATTYKDATQFNLSNWTFYYDPDLDDAIVGITSINESTYAKVVIADDILGEMDEEAQNNFLDELVSNIEISKTIQPAAFTPYTTVSNSTEPIELDSNTSLDLVSNVYILDWYIDNNNNNVLSLIGKDGKVTYIITESEQSLLQTMASKHSTSFQQANYHDRAFNVELDANSVVYGYEITFDGISYYVEILDTATGKPIQDTSAALERIQYSIGNIFVEADAVPTQQPTTTTNEVANNVVNNTVDNTTNSTNTTTNTTTNEVANPNSIASLPERN